MPIHRIRLVETTTMQGDITFAVEAESPQRAAVVVLTAYRTAVEKDHSSVTLPDRQSELIERAETVASSIVLQEIDEDGTILHQMEETELKRAMI